MGSFGRRLEIWRILAGTREGMTLRELARRFGVSKNTVQRDLDELSRAGVAVREEREGRVLRFCIGAGPSSTDAGSDAAVLRAAEAVLERRGEVRLAAQVRAARARPGDSRGVLERSCDRD